MTHPECSGSQGIEPSVGEMLRLQEFLNGVRKLNERELRALCEKMAYQNLVGFPATLRWLAHEAARSAYSESERLRISAELVDQVVKSGGLSRPPLSDDSEV
jgi:hypothetical protein